jgi:hypothetical protein
MAYDRSQILAEAKEAIQQNDLTTVAEVVTYLPCSESILYETEEWKLEVLEPIKKELERKRTSLKAKMKQTWRKSDANPTLQIAAFKLMANDEELNVLNTSKVQNEHLTPLPVTINETRNYPVGTTEMQFKTTK